MTGKSLIKKFALPDDELSRLTTEALGSTTLDELDNAIGKTVAELAPHKIVSGKVIKVQEDGTTQVLFEGGKKPDKSSFPKHGPYQLSSHKQTLGEVDYNKYLYF